jgi:GntR family transcriptional regulator, transcriptional repressor for pyruvate dehydrogenase complex
MAQKLEIQPLPRRHSLGADIAQRLQNLIYDGTFKAGESLPGQRDLATQFGASLASVREAIGVLTAAGLVDAQPGRGTMVLGMTEGGSSFSGWLGMVGNESELAEFVEIRQLLEHYVFVRAAQGSTKVQHQALRSALQKMRDAFNNVEAYAKADQEFHFAIGEVAGNHVLLRLIRAVYLSLEQQRMKLFTQLFEAGKVQESYAYHERMVDAIERRDAKSAMREFDSMYQQSLDVEERLLKASKIKVKKRA